MLKIALGQIEVKAGQIEHNFKQMEAYINEAKASNYDLIVFSELVLSGYVLQDAYYQTSFLETLQTYNDKLLALSQDIGIIWGNVNTQAINGITHGRDGRLVRTNCAYFAYNQEWVKRSDNDEYAGYLVKSLYPDYRFFDDSRYFLSLAELALFDNSILTKMHQPFLFKGYKLGLEICEDLFHENYPLDLNNEYQKSCDYIVNISCSPYTQGKEQLRKRKIQAQAKGGAYFVYVNNVGSQNNGKNILIFDGNSSIYDPQGNYVYGCNDLFTPELGLSNTTLTNPYPSKLLLALIKGIQFFDLEMFNSKVKWIIGLSGGLDSSMSAALLSLALGSERIVGYNMATSYNSQKTKDNAKNLAEALNIRLHNGVIEPLVTSSVEVIKDFDYQDSDISNFTLENIQARIRGHLLSSFAAIEGGVVVNNGNKVEVALGYCTLYGDSIGALSLLADLVKTDLFTLALEINSYCAKEVIPISLLPIVTNGNIEWEMPPSAELKDAQVDPMKWYYHDELIKLLISYPNDGLIKLMEAYLDDSIFDTDLGKWLSYYQLDNPQAFIEDLEWVLRQVNLSVFKRIQMPPILTISNSAFGFDYRESQIRLERGMRFETLKNKILEK